MRSDIPSKKPKKKKKRRKKDRKKDLDPRGIEPRTIHRHFRKKYAGAKRISYH